MCLNKVGTNQSAAYFQNQKGKKKRKKRFSFSPECFFTNFWCFLMTFTCHEEKKIPEYFLCSTCVAYAYLSDPLLDPLRKKKSFF